MTAVQVVFDVRMVFDRETKATYIFRQPADQNTDLVTQALYVKKEAFPEGPPRTVRVRMTAR